MTHPFQSELRSCGQARLGTAARLLFLVALVAGASLCLVRAAPADSWSQFRGPQGQAVSRNKGLPTTWSGTQNLVWKTGPPDPDGSSSIVLARTNSSIASGRSEPEPL